MESGCSGLPVVSDGTFAWRVYSADGSRYYPLILICLRHPPRKTFSKQQIIEDVGSEF